MADLKLSTISALVCAHCGRLLNQSGVIGDGYLIRPCSERQCRESADGAWNLIFRTRDVSFSIALPRLLAKTLLEHVSGTASVAQVAASADRLWAGTFIRVQPKDDL